MDVITPRTETTRRIFDTTVIGGGDLGTFDGTKVYDGEDL